MSRANASNNRGLSLTAKIAGLVLSTAALCVNATAQELTRAPQAVAMAPERTLPELEKSFWACDYKATVHGVSDSGTAIRCSIATDGLRLRKFNGDFDAMLSWWQQNKAVEHRELERAYRAAAHR